MKLSPFPKNYLRTKKIFDLICLKHVQTIGVCTGHILPENLDREGKKSDKEIRKKEEREKRKKGEKRV